MLRILPDDQIVESTTSLNPKYRKVFNVVHASAKHHVKCNEHIVKLVHIFLSGSGGRSTSFRESNISRHIKNIALSL